MSTDTTVLIEELDATIAKALQVAQQHLNDVSELSEAQTAAHVAMQLLSVRHCA